MGRTQHTFLVCSALAWAAGDPHNTDRSERCIVPASSSVCEWLASEAPGEDWLDCSACDRGEWWSPVSRACIPVLGCTELETLAATDGSVPIGSGGVKNVARVPLPGAPKGVFIALSTAKTPQLSDFGDGITALLDLTDRHGSSASVVPLLGHCSSGQSSFRMATPFFSLGSANAFVDATRVPIADVDVALSHLTAATSYLDVLVVLHGPPTPRVLCDAREGPHKLFSQFLVADRSGRLIVNDVDAAPTLSPDCPTPDGSPGVRCGHNQFFPHEYVAPEMLWPHADKPFVDTNMPCYTEKIDIWRVPEAIDYLVGRVDFVGLGVTEVTLGVFRRRLAALGQMCKSINPRDRPTAVQVRRQFNDMLAPLRALIGANDSAYEPLRAL